MIYVNLDKDAERTYFKILAWKNRQDPTKDQLLKSINHVLALLSKNPNHGDKIPKKYLNKRLISFYDTDKLFRVNLVGYWGLLYTIISDEGSIIVLVLDILDHDRYNKLFRYRKK